MINKIQPQQINLHTFSSPSGNFNFTQDASTVKANLHSGQTGSFQFVGGLFVNGGRVQSIHKTNTIGGTAVGISAGQSHFASGVNCSILGGANNEVSGTRNTIVNGNSCQITDDIADGTVLAGYGGLITNNHDGAVVIADARIATKSSIASNALNVDFTNGAFFQNKVEINNSLNVGASGLISGDFNVLGTMYYTGDTVVTARHFTGAISGMSGVLTGRINDASGALSDRLELTGQSLDQRINFDLDELVRQTGDQIISGTKQFWGEIQLAEDILVRGTGATYNSIILEDDASVDISTGKSITLTSLDSIFGLLDTDLDNGSSIHENILSAEGGKWNSSFVIATGNADPDSAHVAFGVHPSGIGWFRHSIAVGYPSNNVPSAVGDAGITGQIVWEPVSPDLTHLYLYHGSGWCRFSGVSW